MNLGDIYADYNEYRWSIIKKNAPKFTFKAYHSANTYPTFIVSLALKPSI